MSPIPFSFSQAASSLLRRDDSSGSRSIPINAIVGIVLLIVGVLSLGSIVAYYVIRRRRRRRGTQTNSSQRGSWVPNNFKVIGGIYSRRQSRRPSTVSTSPLSPYQPTTEYGQYRPPMPKPAYFAGSRVGSPVGSPIMQYNPANLVRHARDKSLPSLP